MKELVQALQATCQSLFSIDVTPELTRPDEQFGDYATNIALQLSKQVGQNPREIAEAIVAQLKHEAVAEALVAGPGFIKAPEAGLCEHLVPLGGAVEAGQPVAELHFIDRPTRESVVLRAAIGGVLWGRRPLAPCEAGDCLAVVATDA